MKNLSQLPTIFVSPCGTSILTNSTNNDTRNLLLQTANYKEKDLTPEQKHKIDEHVEQRRQNLLYANTSIEMVKKLSAELNGIITYYEDNLPTKSTRNPDQHYLLVSDTYQGGKVGEMVAEWLENKGTIAQKVILKDLATDNLETFRVSMSDLIHWCDTNLAHFQSRGHVVFNLTGGFKSVNGFLQAIGMFYAHESVYIFQFSSQLLRIPKLPVTLDKEGIVGQHLEAFRKLGINQSLPIYECESIPETLLFRLDEQVQLSEWGELIWLQCKPQYYQQKLLPALSSKLEYSERFEKEVNELPPERISKVNERLDQLSRCLDSNRSYNPSSLDFKQLTKSFSGSTHECDAWSDGDAKRIYGHFESDRGFVVDRLGKHL